MADFNAKTTKHKIILTGGDLKGLKYPYGLGYGYGRYGYGLGYHGLGLGYDFPYYDYSVWPSKLATAAAELRAKLASIPASPDIATVVVNQNPFIVPFFG